MDTRDLANLHGCAMYEAQRSRDLGADELAAYWDGLAERVHSLGPIPLDMVASSARCAACVRTYVSERHNEGTG